MTITDAVCQVLVDAAPVAALVGPRVYQLRLPQKPTLPALRVQLIAEPSRYHLRGLVNAWQALVQVDAYATEFDPAFPDPYDQVSRLADAVDTVLSGLQVTVDTIRIVAGFRVGREPLYEAEQLRLARILQEYHCLYHDRTRTTSTTSETRRLEDQKEIAHG